MNNCIKAFYLIVFVFTSFTLQAKETFAVIVGVSEYPTLEKNLSLVGPKYDALRVRDMLLQQGVQPQNIQLLADGVEKATLPTKVNIVNAMKSLTERVKAGDFVYLHFSGHGSQQPAMQGSDLSDGLDEIFLPRDIGAWSAQIGLIENSLTDNEMNVILTEIRNTGANVWAVFDSCHSGTMTRSVTGKKVVSRNVRPKLLGVENDTVNVVTRSTLKEVTLDTENAGFLIAFSGAQSNEEAPEMELPSANGDLPQGLFTYTLTSLIGQNPNLSYRQLAQGILSAYNSLPWHKTTPLFEGGEALDKPIFDREVSVNLRYPVTKNRNKYQIQAGLLNGLENGAIVEVYDSVTASERSALIEITKAQVASSEGKLIEGEITNKSSFSQLLRPALPSPLTIKWQVNPEPVWLDALDLLLKQSELLKRTVTWVESDQAADVSLYVSDDLLYFFSVENELLPCALSKSATQCHDQEKYLASEYQITDKNSIYSVLENGISRFVRARNLMRLSLTMAGKASINTEVELNGQAVTLDKPISAQDGDELYVGFINNERNPVDLTVFFVDSGLGIYQVYPEPGYSGRLFTGQSAEFEGIVNGSTTGEEQFVVISVPTSRESPPMTLSHLQQEPMQSLSFLKKQRKKEAMGSLIFSRNH
ncbi:caspase family protein [Psychromonas sp. KJ10-10]|uniref:caspase family protein n=1 Tax=Psychromonas sp. KJ10-10 TaxID=3391823 RepID=UPI0039B410CA